MIALTAAAKRGILRWVHLILTIPILGYIYGPIAEVQQYAPAVRFVFVPVVVLSGLWMYAGLFFAVLGVTTWIGAYLLAGSGAAVLCQVGLFIGRKSWLAIQARRSQGRGCTP